MSNCLNSEFGGVPEWLKGADCKSVEFFLRWFESNLLHFNYTNLIDFVKFLNKNLNITNIIYSNLRV